MNFKYISDDVKLKLRLVFFFFQVSNLFCKEICPGWDNAGQDFVLDGKCVKQCPAGYYPEGTACKKCAKIDDCPRGF